MLERELFKAMLAKEKTESFGHHKRSEAELLVMELEEKKRNKPKWERCKVCGFRRKGPNHDQGMHHTNQAMHRR